MVPNTHLYRNAVTVRVTVELGAVVAVVGADGEVVVAVAVVVGVLVVVAVMSVAEMESDGIAIAWSGRFVVGPEILSSLFFSPPLLQNQCRVPLMHVHDSILHTQLDRLFFLQRDRPLRECLSQYPQLFIMRILRRRLFQLRSKTILAEPRQPHRSSVHGARQRRPRGGEV